MTEQQPYTLPGGGTLKEGMRPMSEEELKGETTNEEQTSEEEKTEEETTSEETSEEEEAEEKEEKEETEEETTSEESSEEDTSEKEESTEESKEGSTEKPEIGKVVSEATENKFNSVEEVYNELQQKEKELQEVQQRNVMDVINDVNGKLQEQFKEHNISGVADFQSVLNADYDNMDSDSKIAEHLKVQDPDMTEKEVRFEIEDMKDIAGLSDEEKKEKIENEELTKKDIERAEVKYERSVRKANEYLKKRQSDLKQLAEQSTTGNESQQGPTQEEIDRMAREDANSVRTQKHKIGKTEVTLELSDEETRQLEGSLKDPNALQRRWVDEKGKFSRQNYRSDMNWLVNREKFTKKIADNMYALGKKAGLQEVDQKEGKKGGSTKQKKGGGKPTSKQEAMARAFQDS